MPPMPKDARPTVVVSALAFRRPEMLRQLLRALAGIDRPEGWRVRFLVVDNDADGSARQVVDECAGLYGDTLDYVIEEAPGIPLARNRALDEATAGGARLLAFIDDDEYPAPDWLVRLVGHYVETGAVLVGGPVRLREPALEVGLWKRFWLRSLVARGRVLEDRAATAASAGKIEMIATNNWLADLEWIAANSIRFDNSMRVSGGSDGRFFFDIRKSGGRVSWCREALVYEPIASERSTLRYHMSRAFSQGVVLSQIKHEGTVRLLVSQSARIAVGFMLSLVPLRGTASMAIGVRMIGGGCGRIAGRMGAKSALYSRDEINSGKRGNRLSARQR